MMASNEQISLKQFLNSLLEGTEESMKVKAYLELEDELLKMKKDGKWKTEDDLQKSKLQDIIKQRRDTVLKRLESSKTEMVDSESDDDDDDDDDSDHKYKPREIHHKNFFLQINAPVTNMHVGDVTNIQSASK